MGVWIYLGDIFPDRFEQAERIDEPFVDKMLERQNYNKSDLLIPKFYTLEQVLTFVNPAEGFEYNGKLQPDDLSIPLNILQEIDYAVTMNITDVSGFFRWMSSNSLYRNSWIKVPTSSKAGVGSVFHYTSSVGAIGIMESRRLRATSIKYLNDRQEFDLGLELAEKVVHDLPTKLNLGRVQKLFARQVLKEVKSTLQRSQLFVLCASKQGDSLSQWRGYGKDHTGDAAGYSLGIHGGSYGFIDNGGLLTNSPSRLPYGRWQNVYYDERAQLELLNEVMAFCIGLVGRVSNWDTFRKNPTYIYLLALASSTLVDSIASCKHESFCEEEEVRMIFSLAVGDSLTKHRPGRTGIVPFIDVQLTRSNPWLGILEALRNTGIGILQNEPLPITKIIVGPSASPLIAEAGLASLTQATGHENVSIDRSSSPYR